MACFVVPATEAIVVKVVAHNLEKRGRALGFVKKTKSLVKLLAGGSVLLAFEHIYTGELIFKFPFLTGENVIREILVNGVAMSILVTGIWALAVLVVSRKICREKV